MLKVDGSRAKKRVRMSIPNSTARHSPVEASYMPALATSRARKYRLTRGLITCATARTKNASHSELVAASAMRMAKKA
jgi:hypothetical protein